MKIQQASLLTQQQSELQQSLVTLESMTAKVTHTTSNLTNTASSYRDALINSSASMPANYPMIDPQVTQCILTQSKQILIDIDNASSKNNSLSLINELTNEIITGLDPLTNLSITLEEVTCL